MHGAARRNTLGCYIAAVLSVLSSNTDFSYRYTYVGSDWTWTLCWRLIVANIYTVVFQSQSQPLITFPVLAMAKADSPPGANIRGCKVFHFTVSLVPPDPAAQLQILSPHLLCSPHQPSLPPWLFFKKTQKLIACASESRTKMTERTQTAGSALLAWRKRVIAGATDKWGLTDYLLLLSSLWVLKTLIYIETLKNHSDHLKSIVKVVLQLLLIYF